MVAASCKSSRANKAFVDDSFLRADRPCEDRRTDKWTSEDRGRGRGQGGSVSVTSDSMKRKNSSSSISFARGAAAGAGDRDMDRAWAWAGDRVGERAEEGRLLAACGSGRSVLT